VKNSPLVSLSHESAERNGMGSRGYSSVGCSLFKQKRLNPLAKYFGAKVGTTTGTGNVDLVKSLGADEVIDYKKQEFEQVLRDYDAVLGTIRAMQSRNHYEF
jgi:hypothetical protein